MSRPASSFGLFERVAVDLARRRLRRQLGVTPGGNCCVNCRRLMTSCRASLVTEAVLELAAQVRQAEQRLAAQILETGHARQGHFQRNRDLTLDLLGDAPGNCATTSTIAGAGSG